MDQQNQPTRLQIDQARQIIAASMDSPAYRDRAEALTWRTLGVVAGLAELEDPARALTLIRAAIRAERELSAVGTPSYDDIMAEPTAPAADRPCLGCGNYPSACTCRIGDPSPRADEPVHTGIGADCAPDCTPTAHRCGGTCPWDNGWRAPEAVIELCAEHDTVCPVHPRVRA